VGQIDFETNGILRLTAKRTYANLNGLVETVSTSVIAAPMGFRYQHNNANQRSCVTLTDGSYWLFGYDRLGQVSSGKRYWADGGPVAGQQFEYGFDDIGNRASTGTGCGGRGARLRAASCSGSSSNLTGSVFLPKTPEPFTYDADGNLLSDGRWTYTWDSENRPIRMEALAAVPVSAKRRLDFEYDALGRRIRLDRYTYNGSAYVLQTRTKFVYDGWTVVAEFDSANSCLAGYLWGLDIAGALPDSPGGGAGGVGGLVLIRQPSPHHFPMYDGNGNVVGLVDATTGGPSATYEYGPVGEPIRATGAMAKANPFRWSTKPTDNDSDLVYYGYRYYNPSTGRWLSRDPIGEKGEPNLYGFVNNDPGGKIDPRGQDLWTINDPVPRPAN
jgi:RHS repeat-associated protein